MKPGLSTAAIDRFVLDFALAHQAYPATLLYRGYRYSVCTSINHVVCHGMPNDKPLREGDIVNIDLTFVLDGWHGEFEPHVSDRRHRAARRAASRGDA